MQTMHSLMNEYSILLIKTSDNSFVTKHFIVTSISFLYGVYNWVGFVGECVGFTDRDCMVWYMLFIIFVPYAMLPLPLKYCMVGGTLSGVAHIIVMTVEKLQKTNVRHLNFIHLFNCKIFHADTETKYERINFIVYT